MAEQLFELRRRTFDTPHFRGITFIESEAKSIINHVPGNYLPFNWTINPYRGCSHACSYCLSGETPILMADGRAKPLGEISVGDAVYGTARRGAYRRYVTTHVLAHWSTVKPAYRVTLADGTELIASGDHRFLSDRGWKHVTGSEQGAHRRPHLTVNDKLMGTGGLATGPRGGSDYRRGYLSELTGGVRTVDPAITRKRTIEGTAIKGDAALDVVSVEDLGINLPMFDITTGTGDFIANGVVSHNCFARVTHIYMDMNAGKDFESKIVVKVNAPELLPKELRAKRWKGEHIAMGTATDPYQRAEGKYRIMSRIISTLSEFRNPFSILTKGTLILRDLDLLVEAARVTDVSTAFSIATLDEDAWRRSEPGTPHPRKRLEAVAKLNDAGIPCGVMLAPILPGITDDPQKMRNVITAAFDAGATHVSPILLHLRPGVKEVYMAWLEDNYPDLVPRYMSMYDGKAYAAKSDQAALSETVKEIVRAVPSSKRNRPTKPRSTWRAEVKREQPQGPEQLSLT